MGSHLLEGIMKAPPMWTALKDLFISTTWNLQKLFHTHLIGHKAKLLIKPHSAGIAAPYIQSNIVAAALTRISQDVFVDHSAHMMPSCCLIHADIVNV